MKCPECASKGINKNGKQNHICVDCRRQFISKTHMTRVEGENTRLRYCLARLDQKPYVIQNPWRCSSVLFHY